MKIYSFEFGSKPLNWYRNEFKDMVFLGTESRKFQQNRNFIKFDEELFTPDIEIKEGTWYNPIMEFPDKSVKSHISTKTGDTSIELLENSEYYSNDFDLAIIVLDKSHFRLIDWCLINDSHEIIKTRDSEYNDIAVVKLSDTGAKSEMVLIVFNNIMKQYEYYEIRYKKNDEGIRTLICRNRTKQVGKEVMDDWKQHDIENTYRDTKERVVLRHHSPFRYQLHYFCTNYIICKDIDVDIVKSIVPDWVRIVPESILSEYDFNTGTKALTFFNYDVFSDELVKRFEKLGIRYYFIMDETGKITT